MIVVEVIAAPGVSHLAAAAVAEHVIYGKQGAATGLGGQLPADIGLELPVPRFSHGEALQQQRIQLAASEGLLVNRLGFIGL